MRFENPLFLLFLIFPTVYLILKFARFKRKILPEDASLLFSSRELLPRKNKGFFARFHSPVSNILICLTLCLFIIALARPLGGQALSGSNYGIDIVLAVDTSGSMLDVDGIPSGLPHHDIEGQRVYIDKNHTLLQYSRLNSAKRVITEYIKKQPDSRIGMVQFEQFSFTRCPLTLDHQMLIKILNDTEYDPQNDGTAIGMGIATAVNRLKTSTAKSKIIILLTDGNNNAGLVDPQTAAGIARDYGIKIYAIGLGNPQGFLQPNTTDFTEWTVQIGAGIDEKTLQSLADLTGGKFYRANNPESLNNIYNDIDKLEKSKIEVKRRILYQENFVPFLSAGIIFFLIWILWKSLIIRLP